MDALKESDSFDASVSTHDQEDFALEVERRGRLEMHGVGQAPRSRSATVAAAVSFVSSVEGVDDIPQAPVCCASSPFGHPL